jgi:hypothetical protein
MPLMRRWLTASRFWIGLVVTLAWLASMGALLRREAGMGGRGLRELGVSPEVLLVSWNDYEHWLTISQNGRRLGLTQLQIVSRNTSPEGYSGGRTMPGYHLQSRTRLSFNMLGLQLPIDMQLRVEMNQAFELQTAQAQLLFAAQRMELQGFVQDNRSLYYRLRIGPQQGDWNSSATLATAAPTTATGAAALLVPRDVCGRMPLQGPVLLTDVIGPILFRMEKLRPGLEWTTQAANNLLEGKLDTTVQVRVERKELLNVASRPVEAWRLTERMGSLSSTVWYDLTGNLLRRDMPNGLRLERIAVGQALEQDPGMRRPGSMMPLDRDYIRHHLSPELTDQPLAELLPEMPKL